MEYEILTIRKKRILTPDEKKEKNVKSKEKFILVHFNGDKDAYNKYVSAKMKALYYDKTKDYKERVNSKRLSLYYKKKAEREALKEQLTVS